MKINVLGADYNPSFEKCYRKVAEQLARESAQYLKQMLENKNNKEENTMKVSYKGVTGELLKLEKSPNVYVGYCSTPVPTTYNLEIWDREKECTISFAGIPLKDVKFLGGEATYGG